MFNDQTGAHCPTPALSPHWEEDCLGPDRRLDLGTMRMTVTGSVEGTIRASRQKAANRRTWCENSRIASGLSGAGSTWESSLIVRCCFALRCTGIEFEHPAQS
jgi:hypothetical protein